MKYTTREDCEKAIAKIETKGVVSKVQVLIDSVKKYWAEGNTTKFHPYYEIICDNS